MNKFPLVLLILFVFACSSDAPESEITDQPNEDIVAGEENGQEGEEMEEDGQEQSFTFPFSVSVILKDFSNPANMEGQFLSIGFQENATGPTPITDVTSMAGLDLDAIILDNGQENVLLFRQGNDLSDWEHVAYNLDTGARAAVNNADLLLTEQDCYWYGSHLGANEDSFFAFNYDLCPDTGGIIPIVRGFGSNSNTVLPTLDLAYTGDTFHRVWPTKEYLTILFDSRDREVDPIGLERDGVIVYDAETFTPVYQTRTPVPKIIAIDGSSLVVRTQSPPQIEIIDLSTGQQQYVQSVSNTEGLLANSPIGNTSVSGSKIAGMVFLNYEDGAFPGIFDVATNTTTIFPPDTYSQFFRTKGLPVPNPIRQPKKHVFDMESETYAVLYHGFTEGIIRDNNPDFIGLVYMSFEGEILYEYEFESRLWLEQLVVKR